ncbi:cation:proton antiporter [Corynebacterium diphtheriae]
MSQYRERVESIYLIAIVLSIAGGLGASILRLPPLIGFLAAGFIMSALGLEQIPFIDYIAELGVTTLLFTIGLKLNPHDIASPRVVGTATAHAVVNTIVFAGLFALFAIVGWTGLLYIGIAASFSSTVFVMSQLEVHSRSGSAVGRISIGVLVLQDIIAVGVLVVSAGTTPQLWALFLPLILCLRPLVTRMPDRMFRTELLVLTGVGIAVGAYSFFELAGVSGSLGSLVAGIVLSGHPVSQRLSHALISVRELLLVAFFIHIGLGGIPDAAGLGIAAILVAFLAVKAAVFFAILPLMGMGVRTTILAGLTLANYSEFGLIVTAVAVSHGALPDQWLPIMAIAVGASFIVGSIVSAQEENLVRILARFVPKVSEHRKAPNERPVIVAGADAIVLGMGRVGVGVYDRLTEEYGMHVYGIEFDEDRIIELRDRGYRIVAGDVTDPELWRRIELLDIPQLFAMSLPRYTDSDKVLARIHHDYPGATVATITQTRGREQALLTAGADVAVYLYEGVGDELADQAVAHLRQG